MPLAGETLLPSLLALLLAATLGSLLGGQLLGRLRGLDLRQSGSGNIGATNALRAGGRTFALAVLLIDAGKGALAAGVLPWLAADAAALPWLCALLAVLGHVYSPWAGFHGGKGAATALGTAAVLLPVGLVFAAAGFLLCLVLSGFVGLSMLFAAALLMFHTACLSDFGALSHAGAFSATLFALLCWTHRENISRMLAGTENRFERVMIRRR